LPQGLIDNWEQALEMSARRHLWDDAAEARMEVRLRGDHVGEDRQIIGEDRGGSLVTGGFERQKVCRSGWS
jgi:hypothetical protein